MQLRATLLLVLATTLGLPTVAWAEGQTHTQAPASATSHEYKGMTFKWLRGVQTTPAKGTHIEGRVVRERLAIPDRNHPDRIREEIMEASRLEHAPHMPSRIDSLFAADPRTAPKWGTIGGQEAAGGRMLAHLVPVDPSRVVIVDHKHFSQVTKLVNRAVHLPHGPERDDVLRQARVAAKTYWTTPVNETSRAEVLVGGGAYFEAKVHPMGLRKYVHKRSQTAANATHGAGHSTTATGSSRRALPPVRIAASKH